MIDRRRRASMPMLLVASAALITTIANYGSLAGAQSEAAPSAPNSTQTPLAPYRLPPTVALSAMPGYGNAPLTVGFFAHIRDPENVGFTYYRWNFGDGHVSTAPPFGVFNTYDQPGIYVATLTAVTADGRSASAFIGITVR